MAWRERPAMVLDQNLLRHVTTEKRVLIWAHSGPLNSETPGLASLDYLLDGLVAGHIKAHAEEPLHHVVFSHPQFGQSFWVGFVNVSQVMPEAFLSALNAILTADAKETVMVYSTEALNPKWEKSVKASFKAMDFLVIQ